MKIILGVLVVLTSLFLAGCATTEFKPYEAKDNLFEGKGGTKVIVDGMEFWDNGEPPRKFRVLGIIDDEHPGGVIPMSQLRNDIVKKAREVGGDAVVQLGSRSQITGFHTTGSASAYGYGSSASAGNECNSLVHILHAGHREISLNCYTVQIEPLPYLQ